MKLHHGPTLFTPLLITVTVGLMLEGAASSLPHRRYPETKRVAVAAQADLHLRDRIYVTEDLAELKPGCDAISAYSLNAGEVEHRGQTIISPGKMASGSDYETVFAARSNGITQTDLPGKYVLIEPVDLYVLRPDPLLKSSWQTTYLDSPVPVTHLGGIAVANGDADLIIATNDAEAEDTRRTACVPDATFTLSRFRIAEIDWAGRRLGPRRAVANTGDPVAEVLVDEIDGVVHVLTVPTEYSGTYPRVLTLDAATLEPVAAPIELSTIGPDTPRCGEALSSPIGLAHASLSPDRRFLMTNRFEQGGLNVADLVERTSWTLLTAGIPTTAGVAFNRGQENRDLIAVHGIDRIGVYRWQDGAALEPWTLAPSEPVIALVDGTLRGSDGIDNGPVGSIAWTARGDELISAHSYVGEREYARWAVTRSSKEIERRAHFAGCPELGNYQNDILTGNGLLPTYTPSPTSTASPTPTPTSAPTRTPLPTFTPVLSPTPEPTATSRPLPIYLPIAARAACVRPKTPLDIVLVIDVSSSMAGEKLVAAKAAASTFIRASDLVSGRDHVAVVSFDQTARQVAPLTSELAVLLAAVDGLTTRLGTRIDSALEEAAAALGSADSRRSGADAAILLLTDGAHGGPSADVLSAAEVARAFAGAAIWTIGLGADADGDLLRSVAEPGAYRFAPDAAALGAVYEALSEEVGCQ